MTDPRYLAVKLLVKTFRESSYSNIQLDKGLDSSDMGEKEKKLCSAVYYGVIERKITLDHIIGGLSSRPLNKLDLEIITILRCGIYQILYMDSIPDSAAVNESVALVKKLGKTSASGMVNAILRNFIRNGKKYELPKNSKKADSVKYSAPEWLIESLERDYGHELMENLLSDSIGQAGITVRMNNTVCTEDEFLSSLGNISAEKIDFLPYSYRLSGGVPIRTDAFKKGFFHVQDIASQLCALVVSPTENDVVLDVCAAPGGKTFTMSEYMGGRGRIYAYDLHEKRAELVRKGAERLKLENITASAADASKLEKKIEGVTKILCDVPCSGVGAIRRKPEIKYKNPKDFERLPEIQYNIALNAAGLLESGGELVYSTCTLRKAENEDVVERLMKAVPSLDPIPLPEPLGSVFGSRASIFPKHFGSDGFFIAKFRKK